MTDPTPEFLIIQDILNKRIEYETIRKTLKLTQTEQLSIFLYAFETLVDVLNQNYTRKFYDFQDSLVELIESIKFDNFNLTKAELCQVLGKITNNYLHRWSKRFGLTNNILYAVVNYIAVHGLCPDLRTAIEQLKEKLETRDEFLAERDLLHFVHSILDGFSDTGIVNDETAGKSIVYRQNYYLGHYEAWTKALSATLATMQPLQRDQWVKLLCHCSLATTSKPSNKWLNQANHIIIQLGHKDFASVLGTVFSEIGKPGLGWTQIKEYLAPPDLTQIHETHSNLLRGLVWSTVLIDDDALTSLVGDVAIIAFRKIPDVGPNSRKVGNGCLWALANKSTPNALAQITRIKSTAKHFSTRKTLEKAVDVVSKKTGKSVADLEEMGVPTHGLQHVGECRITFDTGTAVLRINDFLGADLSWLEPNGKIRKSIPAAVTSKEPEQIKELKRNQKELKNLLPAHRDRLEQLFLQQRSWSLADFRSRFLDHPVIGTLARRIIWNFSLNGARQAGIWFRDSLVDYDSNPIQGLAEDTRVTIWHPHDMPTSEVHSWRNWLENNQVRQPFKQAHREVYILTDAERQTETYSNRFAAHILRQHQFSALCQARGWQYTLQGNWNGSSSPTLDLPLWDLQADFWVATIREGESDQEIMSYSGVYLHITTDQVRFSRLSADEILPLEQVPSIVISEVMRDVDLFVGVASIGNDPNWEDGGPRGLHRNYWQNFAFGELSATAQTRKALLERLIPRLKIATQCTITDKFLIVQGDLRTYKIHLGSGNILMSPNNQYLCIVPGRGATSESVNNVFLPFEGDSTLSIILSKAFLLAEDSKISDPSIISQIER